MNWLIRIGTWVKSHILVTVIASVVIVGGSIATVTTINNLTTKTNIELKDNLNIEVDSEVYLISLIKKISNGELITENKKIDTSKLGKQKITIKYHNSRNKEEKYSFNVNIVDTTKPVIEYNKELSTTIGTEIDLLKDVKVTDNSKEELTATVEGEYDINKVGTYNLKYVVSDSSGNKTEEEFTLNVKDITLKTEGYYVAMSGEWGYGSIKFYSGNKFNWWAAFGDYGSVAVYNGTYKINGNTLTFYSTKEAFEGTDGYEDNNVTFNFTIIDENTIKYDKYTYKWSSTSNLSAKHPKN